MRRDEPLVAAPSPGRVVHIVGRLTEEVCSFLEPAAQAVARSGREQAIVMIDELRYRHHLARLHDSAELVMAPSERNPFKQWSALQHACRTALSAWPLHAVHLHGVLPALAGAQAVRAVRATDAPVFYSPHGSRALGTLHSFGRLVRALLSTRTSAAIVNQPRDTTAFEDWPASELLESPISELFFTVARNEARQPLIVTGGSMQSVRSAELLAQLAVLLGGEDLRVGFNWIGSVDELSRKRLNAAGVGVFETTSDADRAARLAAGWIYLAPAEPRSFPVLMAQAMAAGLPCVAFDCLRHRELVTEGENGFLCETDRDMIERIALLIDDAALRARLGHAGQALARSRFAESQFELKLLAAYAKR